MRKRRVKLFFAKTKKQSIKKQTYQLYNTLSLYTSHYKNRKTPYYLYLQII